MTTQPPDDPYGTQGGGAPNYGSPSYGDATQGAPNPYGSDFPAAPSQTPPERPGSLGLAVKLMYVGVALSLLSFVTMFFQLDAIRDSAREGIEASGEQVTDDLVNAAVAIGIGFGVVLGLIGAGLWVLMAVMNGKGKKWARITATVFGVLGVLLNLVSLTGAGTALDLVFALITVVLAIVILVLLWRKENNSYYEAMSAPRFPS